MRGHFVLALTIACVFAVPGHAAERELEDKPAPGSAKEIETPIESVFPEEEPKPPLFRYFRQRIQHLQPFFSESKVGARFRTYYLHQDRTTNEIREAWAIGGSLYYRSGWLEDVFALEMEGFTSQPGYAPDRRDGTLLLKPVQSGYASLGIANAKLRYKGWVLTGFRQYLDLPYLNRRDNRMTPSTFESVTLSKPEGELRFSAGYTWRIKARASNTFRSMTSQLGFEKDRGLAHAGAIWEPNENFDVGVIGHVVPDLFAGIYSESTLKYDLARGWEARLDGQFTYQWDTGDDLLGSLLEDTWNFGLRGSASYEGIVARLGAVVTGPNSAIQNPFGSSPSYAALMISTFTRADEKALIASLSYDLSRIDLTGLSMIFNFVAAFDGEIRGEHRDSQEFNATIDYRVQRGELRNFWLRARAAWLNQESTGSDGADFRVIVRYDFPVI
jgi:hypothetical protein